MNKIKFIVRIIVCNAVFLNVVCAQITNTGMVAKFGIDGDLYSDYHQNGSWSAPGSGDWFKTANGSGIGIIDTSGTSNIRALLSTGQNISFTKSGNIPQYSMIDTILHMDAKYARDYNGSDKTCFGAGSKNGDNPSSWGTIPGGGSVQDKSDIIDVYASMRRNGTNLSTTNPSRLILLMAATTLGTTGVRYIDFELYVSKLAYDSITGVFSNGSPASQGGHDDFQFNSDGSLKKIGDVDVSFSYTSATVTDISIFIWVAKTTYLNTYGQQKFDFIPGEFYGAGNNANWGYAKIVAKSGFTLPLWGAVSSASITGPAWGTASKDLSSNLNGYFSLLNAQGQFSETAVDLTSIGIDPVFNNTNGNKCSPPFTRIMVKTRSSASFTSALSDFAGPYSFLDAPTIPANIVPPLNLSCTRTSVTLNPVTINPAGIYSWLTQNGSIIGRADTSVITIGKPGVYYLSTSPFTGCSTNIDSVIITGDFYQPVATASANGTINATFTNTCILFGGNASWSNYSTPFGGSQGITYEWSGPNGFSSNLEVAFTPDTGWHRLIVTEIRNGCKDTAYTYVPYNISVLSVKVIEFTGLAVSKQKTEIKWKVENEAGNEIYELERSIDGVQFTKACQVMALVSVPGNAYTYLDDLTTILPDRVFYRIKIIRPSGEYYYTRIVTIDLKKAFQDNFLISVINNPALPFAEVNYFTKNAEHVKVRILDINGKIIFASSQTSLPGNNVIFLQNNSTETNSEALFIQLMINLDIFIRKIYLFN